MPDSRRLSLQTLNGLQCACVAAVTLALSSLWWAGSAPAPGGVSSDRQARDAVRTFGLMLEGEVRGSVRDAANLAASLQTARQGDGFGSEGGRTRLLSDWIARNPRYRAASLIGIDNRVVATSSPGAADLTVGRADLRHRPPRILVSVDGAQGAGPFDITVYLGDPGRSERLQLSLDESLLPTLASEVRAAEGLDAQTRFAVSSSSGVTLVGSDTWPSAAKSTTVPLTVGRGMPDPGWLLTVAMAGEAATSSAIDMRTVAAALGLVAAVAAAGVLAARGPARSLRRLAAGMLGPGAGLDEIAALSAALSEAEASRTGAAAAERAVLERTRSRLRVFETMSGWTCWEIDPEARHILWSDRNAPQGDRHADRSAGYDHFRDQFDSADGSLLDATLAASLKEDGPHDVVLHGPRTVEGQQPQFLIRFLRGPSVDGARRVYALSRIVDPDASAGPPSAHANERRRNHVLRRVVDGVVGEFSEAATAILSNLGALQARASLRPDERQLLDNATEGAWRGAAMTRRMLAFVRGQTDSLVETDVAMAVTNVVPLVQANARHNIPILTRIPDGLPRVLFPSRDLELALTNIAFHAHVAGLRGITVSASSQADQADVDGRGIVRLSITGGPGEASISTSRFMEAADRLLTEGGAVWRLSPEEPGAAFACEIDFGAAEEIAPVRSGHGRALRVLLVEADGLVRAGVGASIRNLGHELVLAASGDHALEILAGDERFDALIADQSLPVMSGLQLAATIAERYPAIKVVIAGPSGQLPKASRLFLHLDKPFRQGDLARALAEADRSDMAA